MFTVHTVSPRSHVISHPKDPSAWYEIRYHHICDGSDLSCISTDCTGHERQLLGNGIMVHRTRIPADNKSSIRRMNVGVYNMGAGNVEDPPVAVVLMIRLQQMTSELSEDEVSPL